MKKYLFISLFLGMPLLGGTLQVCNRNSDRAIYGAFLQQVGNGSGWQSRGWYKVNAAECKDFSFGNYIGKVYFYADDEYHETNWGESDVEFCVHSINGFKYDNADSIACNQQGQKRVKSDPIDMAEGTTVWEVKPNFSQLNLCNKNTDIQIYASYAKQNGTTWDSSGWYSIAAGACRLVTVGKYSGFLYTYAEYNGGTLKWGDGPFQFCVNRTSAFKIANADQASSCQGSELKMIDADRHDIAAGVTHIDFSPQTQGTQLRLCNKTSNRNLTTAYATHETDGDTKALRSTGWHLLTPSECKEFDLNNYRGPVQVYAEWNGGEEYWGNGPVNMCVHKTENFTFLDAGNTSFCSSNIKRKMVPTTAFTVGAGKNTFNFTP